MADDVPCGCECEKFELEQFPGVYGGTYPPFSVDGDVFSASATVDASSSVTLRVNGILPTPVNAVASWVPAYDMKQAISGNNSVSIQGASKTLIRVGTRIPLRFDACAVNQPLLKDLLLTASAECSAKASPQFNAEYGSYVPTPMNFYKAGQNWPFESQLSSWLTGIYAKTPPDGVYGNDAAVFEIYRDGTLVAEFESPSVTDAALRFDGWREPGPFQLYPAVAGWWDGYTNEYGIANNLWETALVSGNVNNGDGSFLRPLGITSRPQDPWAARITALIDGCVVIKWSDAPLSRILVSAGQQIDIQNYNAFFTFFDGYYKFSTFGSLSLYLVPALDRHPFPQSVKDECSQEGSYLVVAKHSGSATSEMLASRGYGSRQPTPLVSYGSFVILNTKWAFATGLPSDRFSDEEIESVDSAIHRENPFKERAAGIGNDVAGNGPLFSGSLPQPVTHQFAGRRGARSAFVKPAPFGGEESLVYDAPLTKIAIRFNRPVVGLTASMFTVTGHTPPNGEQASLQVQSVSLADGVGYLYDVTIASSGQVPNSMWIIKFTPTGEVGLNLPRFSRQEFANRQSFPASGRPDSLYIDKATGSHYLWEGGALQYRQVENASEPELGGTVLAARFMWCLAKDKSIGRYWIDTFPDGNPFDGAQDRVVIPRASASVTVTPQSRPEGDMSLTLLTDVADIIDSSSSKRSTLSDQGLTDFIPMLPASSTTPTDQRFSYFGVPTTIHPAAPRWIGECASPSEVQRHASLIFSGQEISTFTVENLELHIPSGFVLHPSFLPPIPNSFVVVGGLIAGPDTTRVPVSVSATSDGMSQNFWKGSGGGTTLLSADGRVETSIDSVTVVISANRGRLTYREMQTTTVTELVLTVHAWCAGSFRWRMFGNEPGSFGEWLGSKEFETPALIADIIVPPDRETMPEVEDPEGEDPEGEEVWEAFGSLEDTQGRIWTITKGSEAATPGDESEPPDVP